MENKTIIDEIKAEATNQANIWKFITQSDHRFFEECFTEGAKWMMNKQNKEIEELKQTKLNLNELVFKQVSNLKEKDEIINLMRTDAPEVWWRMEEQVKLIKELKEKAERYDKLSNKDKLRSILGKPSKWVVKMLNEQNNSLQLEKQELLDFIKKYYKGTGTDFDIQANELINKYENK